MTLLVHDKSNQFKSFQVSLPSTNASALIVTTPQDFEDRGDVLFGEGEVIPCVSIEERLPTYKTITHNVLRQSS